jgi:hypothetical protein
MVVEPCVSSEQAPAKFTHTSLRFRFCPAPMMYGLDDRHLANKDSQGHYIMPSRSAYLTFDATFYHFL